MSRRKTAVATAEAPGIETAADVFDQAIADRDAEPAATTTIPIAQEIVQSVAAAHAMPETSHAAGVEKKKWVPPENPFGGLIVKLSPENDGPKARLLRYRGDPRDKDPRDHMWIQFTQNPSEEIPGAAQRIRSPLGKSRTE
jgi:hypothetical protein